MSKDKDYIEFAEKCIYFITTSGMNPRDTFV